jgi:hypothetical protein
VYLGTCLFTFKPPLDLVELFYIVKLCKFAYALNFIVNGFIVQAQSATNTYTTSSLIDGDDVSVKVVNTSSGCYDEQNIFITVNTPTVSATDIAIANNGSCVGNVKTLTPIGGSLGVGASCKWYSEASCTNLLHTGSSFDVDPLVDTQYWLRAEGSCNTTAAISRTVIVAIPPTKGDLS